MHIQAGHLLSATLLLGMVQAHAEGPVAAPTLTIEVDQSSPLLAQRVEYQRTANGIEVSGRVAKRGERRGRIQGHVDIILIDARGQTLAKQEAALVEFGPSRKNPDWAGFSTRIEPLPDGVQGLRVVHSAGG
jgi:hypothetical protein